MALAVGPVRSSFGQALRERVLIGAVADSQGRACRHGRWEQTPLSITVLAVLAVSLTAQRTQTKRRVAVVQEDGRLTTRHPAASCLSKSLLPACGVQTSRPVHTWTR